jgi:hypothetical protein
VWPRSCYYRLVADACALRHKLRTGASVSELTQLRERFAAQVGHAAAAAPVQTSC